MIYFQKVFYVCFMEYFMYSYTPVNLRFRTLLKNQVEWIFLALLSCWFLYASCWFSWDILSLTKILLKNVSSWDLLPRFLDLWIAEFFCSRYLNVTTLMSKVQKTRLLQHRSTLIWNQSCKSSVWIKFLRLPWHISKHCFVS